MSKMRATSSTRREPPDAGAALTRAETSRQQILDVAARMFRERGYSATSLRDLASLVGMKAGSLYYHFSSKEELATEVLRIGVERVAEAVSNRLESLGPRASAAARIRAAVEAHVETLLLECDYTSAHTRCYPYVPESVKVQVLAARRAYEDQWRQLIAAAGAAVPRARARYMRLALLGALNLSVEWFDPDRDDVRQYARVVSDMIWAAARIRAQ